MSKIRILPEHLANQIAAGEVIERPASAVKELLENSLDAGADRIEVDVEGGGTRLIRVSDNGEGMDEDDVLLCLERHGTSKLSEANQLSGITTLGFRGEAIPSIAAVSRLTITSRPRGSDLGTTVACVFGTIRTVRECGAPVGTSIEVADLFGNTPARRKFLRTARTELAHIDDMIRSCALARPDIALILRVDGRETLRLGNDASREQRLAQLLNYHDGFITVETVRPAPDHISVRGLLLPPEIAAPVAGRLRLLVNGRVIRDRLLTHAVGEGLRSFLLKGRYPSGLIAVDLPPETVDVNVHPAKSEVRFRDSRTIHHLVSESIRQSMLAHQQRLRQAVFHGNREERAPAGDGPAPLPLRGEPMSTTPGSTAIATAPPSLPRSAAALQSREPAPILQRSSTDRIPESDTEPISSVAQIRLDDLVVIGCYRDLYIFCRNRDRLVVIDQHAAHERLLFEELRRQYATGRLASQQLLFPTTVELTPQQVQLVEDNLARLEEMGFGLRDFGATTWLVTAVPAVAGTMQPQQVFFDILACFGDDRFTADNRIDQILATMACKAAVKAGDHLHDREIASLLQRMAAADLFSHCPHGRPVVKLFSETELKKWFSRG
ncbi:DNA mismatch repair endonuclease MutL [Desulfofustis limnaeus]|jgi:DNA mismatch repair protein MutL|uniref:DNA mismatch repair protein MutL n=1 Tax=Desulfofustis limnaeus TaxID=2740163 RepID=A0ABN6M7B2_9BACT|nr:DNA mismatch repair endonuclease MutL [Desulfofustis limnaeus]MDX9894780.1 DNA mismatch repair endonuclease MutL [Desulfofustis sp.]BDD87810.1 DNA mismatch repair protein MutL [Desulfofustis limnaeus]